MPEIVRPDAISSSSRRYRWMLVAALIVAAFAGGLIVATFDHSSRGPSTLAPEIKGTTATGRSFDLTSSKGHWVLLNFFASWCTECRTEMPALAQLQHQRPHGLQIVSVDTDDSLTTAAHLVKRTGESWIIVNDPDAVSTYHVVGLPESFLLDPAGGIAARIVGVVHVAAVIGHLH